MKQPITTPELSFGQQRFPLQQADWESWASRLQPLGIDIRVQSRQHLEDCEARTTDVIATQGVLTFLGASFPFTAQLDCDGYALYVGDSQQSSRATKELFIHLHRLFPSSK